MPDRGKLAVLTMLGVALAAAAFAWWWNIQSKKQSLAFFGPTAARLIGKAPTVELIEVEPAIPGDTGESISIGDQHFTVLSRHDVSKAQGLIHARTALLDDASYEWQDQFRSPCGRLWFASPMAATKPSSPSTPPANSSAAIPARAVRLNPKISAGWQQFAERHFGD